MTLKAWLLWLHRWLAIVFTLPLAVLILTGLILSFEPILTTAAIKPGAVPVEKVEQALRLVDPQGKARSLTIRAYEGTMAIGGRGGATEIALATAAPATPADTALSRLFRTTRMLHESFMIDSHLAVQVSTFAMLGLIALGLLMGWPRIRNTLGGWHKAAAWGLLPLLILSPVTGLLLGYGITFAPQPPTQSRPAEAATTATPMSLVDAVRIVGARHDLSAVVWIRPRGDGLIARINDGGVYTVMAVTPAGLRPLPANWPRALHEGNWAGVWSGLANLVTSLAFVLLLATGLLIFARRQMRRSTRHRAREAAAA